MDHLSVDAQALDELRSSTAPETRLRDGSTACRVGRNPVWRLTTSDGQHYFVKLCRDGDDFARQVFGLRIAGAMAAADARFMAADVVEADPGRRLLVTRPIGGVMVRTLFARGFRRDRNPLGRGAARAEGRAALALVRAWLDALHAWAPDPDVPLYDHSRDAVWQRTARKLDALSAIDPGLSAYAGFARQWRLEAVAGDETLVFGDAILANFFVHDGRVGAVDFEDIGHGSAARDLTMLHDEVVAAFSQVHYRSDQGALEQLEQARRRRGPPGVARNGRQPPRTRTAGERAVSSARAPPQPRAGRAPRGRARRRARDRADAADAARHAVPCKPFFATSRIALTNVSISSSGV